MKYILLVMVFISSFLASSNEFFTIEGRVLSEQGGSISNAVISVGNDSTKSSITGQYILKVKISDIYQLKLSHPEYYSSIQTFSHFELSNQKKHLSKIHDISLVKKTNKRVMLAFAGDVMMGRRFYNPYFGDSVLISSENKLNDSKAIVQHIKPYMSLADYAAVNLETQIADSKPAERAPKSVTFYSAPETLDALAWAGIDYVSLGNNHTYDYMESGLNSTLAFLKKSDLGFSGAGIDETSALKPHITTINDIEYAMLGYVGWEGSATPTQTANFQHGGAAYGSMSNIVKSVSEQVAHNKLPIVQYHGSQEYADNPTGVTEQRLKSSLDAGAVLAIAHHPHVTQGLELYNNKLIAYSMGNFIFDQNFSATQHSFILYVWLDEGKFHRAEIVPIYVKGYKPTPSTGMHRYTVMRRLTELSKQRDTLIIQSGGHGVIQSKRSSDNEMLTQSTRFSIDFETNERVTALYQLPWDREISQVLLPEQDVAYRLGTNLINGSDFESFSLFDSPERGWLFDRNATKLNNFGASGSHSLAIALTPNSMATFGMQSFRRVYNASSVMTLKAKFLVDAPVKINFYWQGRKTSQKLFDAFENSPLHLIGTKSLSSMEQWQNVELDFNSPRVGYRSYRVLAEIQSTNDKDTLIHLDDFALIEWQTAFNKKIEPDFFNNLSHQASYLGVDKSITLPIMIKY